MKGTKVQYREGDNNKFDYFIVAKKAEIELDKNSLAYLFDPSSDKTEYIDIGAAEGSFDYLIAEHKKENGEYIRPIFCDASSIVF